MEKHQNMDANLKRLVVIKNIILLIFIIAVVFDYSVTLTIASREPETFVNHEANQDFVFAYKNNNSFFFTTSFILNLFLIYFFEFIALPTFPDKYTKLKYIIISSYSFLLIYLALAHFSGGMSWLK